MELTPQIDELIHQSQYSQITLAIWVMWVAVLVVLIALGLDFWRNIVGMIFFPRFNFSRIAGELQVIPNMFVALMFGLINGIIGFYYYRIDIIKGSFLAQVQNTFAPMIQMAADMTGMELAKIVDTMMADPDYVFGLLATVPILCGFGWFFFGFSLFLVGKFVSKAGGSLSNYLCGISYFSWITPFLFLGYWVGFQPGNLAMVYNIIGGLLLAFYLIMTIRDFYHVSWGKAIISVLIVVPILFAILMALFVLLVLVIVNQIGAYTG